MGKEANRSDGVSGVQYETADRIHSTAIRMLRLLRLQDKASGIGPARLSALSVLVFAGPQSLKSLAEIEQVKQPTMTRIVAGMGKLGLARIRKDPSDARRMIISATSRGRQVLSAARTKRIAFLAQLLLPLSRTDLQALRDADKVLKRILAGC